MWVDGKSGRTSTVRNGSGRFSTGQGVQSRKPENKGNGKGSGETCHRCGKPNHFARECFAKRDSEGKWLGENKALKSQENGKPKVRQVGETEEDDDEDNIQTMLVTTSPTTATTSPKAAWTARRTRRRRGRKKEKKNNK